MNKKRFILKKLGILMILLCLCLAVLPGNVDAKAKAKTKAKTKTVKIHKFSSGNKKVDKKVRSVIKKYIKPKMSTAERVRVIHDYIISNCDYDYKNYIKGKIPKSSYSPVGVLLKKKAVCQGYAETFQLFMDALGIPCCMVSGIAGSGDAWGDHAWNRVKIGKKWYHVDTTWDDGDNSNIYYEYFLVNDKKLQEDHKWFNILKCKGNNSKFVTAIGKVSNTMDEAVDNFYKGYKKDKKHKVQIIVHKKLYNSIGDSSFKYELFQNVELKYKERITKHYWNSTTYGNYYVLTYEIVSTEKVVEDATTTPSQ